MELGQQADVSSGLTFSELRSLSLSLAPAARVPTVWVMSAEGRAWAALGVVLGLFCRDEGMESTWMVVVNSLSLKPHHTRCNVSGRSYSRVSVTLNVTTKQNGAEKPPDTMTTGGETTLLE